MAEPGQFDGHLSLRGVVRPDDDDFLEDLYLKARDDLGGAPADPGQLRQLLSLQFRAQTAAYEREYPNATHNIIVFDGEQVGRSIVERRPGSMRLVDIVLLPAARNRGIGTRLIKDLIAECETQRVPLLLQVIATSPALALYERLGFRVTGSGDGIRLSMEWAGDEPK